MEMMVCNENAAAAHSLSTLIIKKFLIKNRNSFSIVFVYLMLSHSMAAGGNDCDIIGG